MLPPPKNSNDFNFYAAVFSYFSTITRFSLQLQVIHPSIFFHCLWLDPVVVIPGKGAGHIGRAIYLRTYLYSSFSPKQRVPDYKWATGATCVVGVISAFQLLKPCTFSVAGTGVLKMAELKAPVQTFKWHICAGVQGFPDSTELLEGEFYSAEEVCK